MVRCDSNRKGKLFFLEMPFSTNCLQWLCAAKARWFSNPLDWMIYLSLLNEEAFPYSPCAPRGSPQVFIFLFCTRGTQRCKILPRTMGVSRPLTSRRLTTNCIMTWRGFRGWSAQGGRRSLKAHLPASPLVRARPSRYEKIIDQSSNTGSNMSTNLPCSFIIAFPHTGSRVNR